MGFDARQLGVVDAAGAVRADGLEHVLHGERLVLFGTVLVAHAAVAGHDRAAVEDHGRQVQARGRHRRGGDGLVAADQQHHRVQAMAVDGQLDRIGDGLA